MKSQFAADALRCFCNHSVNKGKMTFNCYCKCTSMLLSIQMSLLVLMVTQVGRDVLIDLGGVEFPFFA